MVHLFGVNQDYNESGFFSGSEHQLSGLPSFDKGFSFHQAQLAADISGSFTSGFITTKTASHISGFFISGNLNHTRGSFGTSFYGGGLD